MGQDLILAVERNNLTEQDNFRLLVLDRTKYKSEELFKIALSKAIADRTGKTKVIIGTFAEWVRYARENADFKPEYYTIINVEIDY